LSRPPQPQPRPAAFFEIKKILSSGLGNFAFGLRKIGFASLAIFHPALGLGCFPLSESPWMGRKTQPCLLSLIKTAIIPAVVVGQKKRCYPPRAIDDHLPHHHSHYTTLLYQYHRISTSTVFYQCLDSVLNLSRRPIDQAKNENANIVSQ
jgi:hypothetical protein